MNDLEIFEGFVNSINDDPDMILEVNKLVQDGRIVLHRNEHFAYQCMIWIIDNGEEYERRNETE